MRNEAILETLDKEFGIASKERQHVVYSCPATDLLDDGKMKQLLQVYTPMIKGTDSSVGEVYMAGWFRGPMLGLLYMLSARNKTLDLSLNNMTLDICEAFYNEKKYYSCGFRVHRSDLTDGPTDNDQNMTWTRDALTDFFEQTVRPVFETIASVGSLQIGMLWSQLPTSLEYGYDSLMKSSESEEVKHQVARNYKLMKTISAERFGRSKNPLDVKFRMTESMDHPDRQVRMKFACCLYYLVEDGDYCFTCPKLKESDREMRRAECRTQKQAQ